MGMQTEDLKTENAVSAKLSKRVALLLSLTLAFALALPLAGCGNKKEEQDAKPATEQTEKKADEKKEANKKEEAKKPAEKKEEAKKPAEEKGSPAAPTAELDSRLDSTFETDGVVIPVSSKWTKEADEGEKNVYFDTTEMAFMYIQNADIGVAPSEDQYDQVFEGFVSGISSSEGFSDVTYDRINRDGHEGIALKGNLTIADSKINVEGEVYVVGTKLVAVVYAFDPAEGGEQAELLKNSVQNITFKG